MVKILYNLVIEQIYNIGSIFLIAPHTTTPKLIISEISWVFRALTGIHSTPVGLLIRGYIYHSRSLWNSWKAATEAATEAETRRFSRVTAWRGAARRGLGGRIKKSAN